MKDFPIFLKMYSSRSLSVLSLSLLVALTAGSAVVRQATTAAPTTTSAGTTAAGATTTVAATTAGATTTTTAEETCFPASARAIRADGTPVRMEDIAVGDVLRVGGGKTSPVFMFTHKDSDYVGRFVELTVGDAKLTLTSSHFLYVNGALAAAKTVSVGDDVEMENGDIRSVSTVREVMERGIYNPQTVHGDIVVEGIRASTYTQAVEATFAHAALAPLRAAFETFGWFTTAFDNGSPMAKSLPSGSAVY